MNGAWIELNGVRLSRGGRVVLDGLSCSLAGRAIGLVGANGAGKSTLIGALLGVLKADSGSIRVLGMELPGRAMEVRARAGVMAEQAGVFPGGSGVDAVVFAAMLSGLPRREALRKAHRALDALDVGEERYRAVRGYSTGMRQRCKLAMSLVHDPEVLILDEPTVGLDPPGRTQLLSLIRDLRDEGRRVLVSTHIMYDADFLCDELLLLDAGTVAYSGTIGGLVGTGVGVVVASGSGLDAAFADALGREGYNVREHDTERIAFEPGDDAGLHRFWRLAAERGAEVRSLGRDIPTLESAVVLAMERAHER
jgi:ABC-2 type transport system ATP-binding protein